MAALHGTLKAQKKALRKAVSSKLATLTIASVEEQSEAVTARVLSLPAFRQCKSISCYLSMPSGEINTYPLVSELLKADKALYVPKIQSKEGHMNFFKIYGTEDLNSLPNGVWGIKEPDPVWQGELRSDALNLSSEPLDMILVPGVAFDRSLARLGHGKGYYDRFINSYIATGRKRPLLVGLALREQLLDDIEVPMDDHDWGMDVIVTPDETLGSDTASAAER